MNERWLPKEMKCNPTAITDIAGYQPLQKWMKDRKGCVLSKDEIIHYSQMITAVKLTIEIMDRIDQIIQF